MATAALCNDGQGKAGQATAGHPKPRSRLSTDFPTMLGGLSRARRALGCHRIDAGFLSAAAPGASDGPGRTSRPLAVTAVRPLAATAGRAGPAPAFTPAVVVDDAPGFRIGPLASRPRPLRDPGPETSPAPTRAQTRTTVSRAALTLLGNPCRVGRGQSSRPELDAAGNAA